MYNDANDLYGWAISQSLPYEKLKWVKEKDHEKVLQNVVISSQKELDKAEVGYYFEVDLKYPEELHKNIKTFHMLRIKKARRRNGLAVINNHFL